SENSWSTRIGTFKFPSCQPYVCPIQFTDVSSNHTFYNFIRCLACKGIISGYSDGMFYPNNYVNRGQIAKFISNAAFLADKAAQGTWTFHDVPSSNPYYVWVERVANVSLGRNFIGGYPCGGQFEPCDSENRAYFRPYNNATRGQISKMISLAALFVEPVNPNIRTFEDVPNTNEFWSYIERLASRHIITGYPCGGVNPQTQAPEPCGVGNRPYFRWGNSVTRGQTAQIIARSFFPNSNCENPPPDIIEEPSTEKPLATASVPVPPAGTPGVTSTPGTTSTPIPTPTEVLPPPVSTWPAVPSPVPTGPASTVPVP
ncbi:MAG TPA: S-layer homology domain-containing protein, partial [Chloroflexia bacterium]|nr:S-layer homology domain-containing protein [Chloroflexia bacterium]